MEKIHLVGAKGIDPKKIERLEGDIKHLLANTYRRKGVAQKMGKHVGNFSKVVTGKLPVSHAFIEDFYRIFWEELSNESELNDDSAEYRQRAKAQEPTLADVMAILQRIESKIDRQAGTPDADPESSEDKKEN